MSTSAEDLGIKEDAAGEKMHVEISEAREGEPHYVMEWEEDGGGGGKAAKREMYSDSSVARFSHPH